jgi:hypothetical protein
MSGNDTEYENRHNLEQSFHVECPHILAGRALRIYFPAWVSYGLTESRANFIKQSICYSPLWNSSFNGMKKNLSSRKTGLSEECSEEVIRLNHLSDIPTNQASDPDFIKTTTRS